MLILVVALQGVHAGCVTAMKSVEGVGVVTCCLAAGSL